jgi:hypothetical protein
LPRPLLIGQFSWKRVDCRVNCTNNSGFMLAVEKRTLLGCAPRGEPGIGLVHIGQRPKERFLGREKGKVTCFDVFARLCC